VDKISFAWTILLGLVIGIGANVLTPFIKNLLGKVSTSVRQTNEIKREIFNRTVQYLIENPYEEINLRNDKNTYFIVGMMFALMSLLFAVILQDLFIALSIILALLSIWLFIKFWRRHNLCIAAWRYRKERHPDIDLDFK
jgi:hypothetical protein